MTITYKLSRIFLLSLCLISFSVSQSLEDKVSQAQVLQAQSLLGIDDQTMETLLQEKRALKREKAGGRAKDVKDLEFSTLDSLLAGPLQNDEDSNVIDSQTVTPKDSISKRARKTQQKPPKRFEQRIFKNINRSVFSSTQGAVGRDYVVGPGDNVMVSIWGDKEKEYDLFLNGEGKIFLEGIGLVPLGGLNLKEAQALLKQKLARIYSGISRGSTQVDVSLVKAGPIKVFVLGEVKVPGGYVFSGNTSVLSALYFSQGPTDIGSVRNLRLTRAGQKYSLDLYRYLIHGEGLNPDLLRDGDILFSPRAEILVEIEGDVGRPATYELKKGEGIKELLEYAGQLNPTAAGHVISMQRIFDGGKVDYMNLAPPKDYLSGKATAELFDGDRIMVEKSSELSKNFLTIAGPVKYPGTYAAEGVSNVQGLVDKAGGLREDAFLGRIHVVRFKPDGSSHLFAFSLENTFIDSIPLMPRDNVFLYSLKDMYVPDSVEISGAVFFPGKYEFRQGMTAKDLVMQAGGFLPQHESGRLVVFRGETRNRKVEQVTLDIEDGLSKSKQNFPLNPRDHVQVPFDPRWYQKEIITLGGLFLRPGKYSLLHPGEKLSSLIERSGGFKESAYIEGSRFFRSKDSVGRVGVDLKKAVDHPGGRANIPLVGGDSIFIPERLNTVKVIGEVGFETSVLFRSGSSVQYYIEKAGGFTRRSEKDRVVVQYANGETSRDGYFNRKPDAGSVIYVPQGPDPKPIEWFSGINTLLGTMGVAAAVILSIQAIRK